jgi:hypothetical protein
VLAAVLYVVIPRVLGVGIESAIGVFGLLALFVGRMPGGLVAQLGRLGQVARSQVAAVYADARRPAPEPPPVPVPTAFAERVLAEGVLVEQGAP